MINTITPASSLIPGILSGEVTALVVPFRNPQPPEGSKIYQYPDSIVWHDQYFNRYVCPYRVGHALAMREAIWSKHDTDTSDYSAIDCGPYLDGGREGCPGWDYVATPNCLNPPSDGKHVPYTGDVVPGEWWFAPPEDWNDTDEDYDERGEYVFQNWQYYTKHSPVVVPVEFSRATITPTTDPIPVRVRDVTDEQIIACTGAKRLADRVCSLNIGGRMVNGLAQYLWARYWYSTYPAKPYATSWGWYMEIGVEVRG